MNFQRSQYRFYAIWKIHAAARRAADMDVQALKQNDYRDTRCTLRAVCEYKPPSHPHHCCQNTSIPGSTLGIAGRARTAAAQRSDRAQTAAAFFVGP